MNNHGDDIYRYPHIRLNFSSNIWGHANLEPLKAWLASRLDVISHYPEPDTQSLNILLAERMGISPEEVLVTNGATEAIHLIRQCFAGYRHDIPQPTFSEYGMGENNKDDCPTVHWRCNPNNPTGQWSDLVAFVSGQNQKQDVYVIDQAYEDYTLKPMLKDADIVRLPNVILLHSMTKKFCIPGLRLGYATGNAKIIGRLRAIKQPWSVNALAGEAGRFLLENKSEMIPPLHWLLDETQRLREGINGVKGFNALPSDTQFFLIRIADMSSSAVKERLAKKGILVRDCSNFNGLDNHYIRVATQLPEENDALTEALGNI